MRVVFPKQANGRMILWIQGCRETAEQAKPLTDCPGSVSEYCWSEDSSHVVYTVEPGEDGGTPIFVCDVRQTVETGAIAASRNLTPTAGVTAQFVQVSRKNPDLIYVVLNQRDPEWYDLYQISLSTGDLKLLHENKQQLTGYEIDRNDQLRLVYQGNTLLSKEGDTLTALNVGSWPVNGNVLGWTPDNRRFYLETNYADRDLREVYLLDPQTQTLELFEGDPEQRCDFRRLQLSPSTGEAVCTSYLDDRNRYYWRDAAAKANHEFLQQQFPGRETEFISSSKDQSKFLVSVWGDRFATEVWYSDALKRELFPHYSPLAALQAVEQHLAPMNPVRYKSSDGLEIPGYLTLPVGCEAKKLPLGVLVHVGPRDTRDEWGYDPEVQFLAHRGYAVLQSSFRASGGFGKKFLDAGNGEWGRLMQDDLAWGVKYLVERESADPDRIGLMGASYGGYATLAGLAFTPDLYACGVDIVGTSNLFTFLERLPPYINRKGLYAMIVDPSTRRGQTAVARSQPAVQRG